jgi:hypothetical protein
VYVTSSGQLGTVLSSRRFKDRIEPIAEARHLVQALRPVQFTYKRDFDDGSRLLQYGLIAEEVAEVDPNLVVMTDGEAQGCVSGDDAACRSAARPAQAACA